MGNLPRAMAPGPPIWWTRNNSIRPVSKEKYRFVWLPQPKLVCYISPPDGSIFKGLQEKPVISIEILLLYYKI